MFRLLNEVSGKLFSLATSKSLDQESAEAWVKKHACFAGTKSTFAVRKYPNWWLFTANDGKEYVGHALWGTNEAGYKTRLYLIEICVIPERRKEGWGSWLFENCLAFFKVKASQVDYHEPVPGITPLLKKFGVNYHDTNPDPVTGEKSIVVEPTVELETGRAISHDSRLTDLPRWASRHASSASIHTRQPVPE